MGVRYFCLCIKRVKSVYVTIKLRSGSGAREESQDEFSSTGKNVSIIMYAYRSHVVGGRDEGVDRKSIGFKQKKSPTEAAATPQRSRLSRIEDSEVAASVFFFFYQKLPRGQFYSVGRNVAAAAVASHLKSFLAILIPRIITR